MGNLSNGMFTLNIATTPPAGWSDEPVESDPNPEIKTKDITVYFNNPSNWSNVCAHTWEENGDSPDEPITSWPGVEMTLDEEYGAYKYTIEKWNVEKSLGILFNDGNAGKTGDLSLTSEQIKEFEVWTFTCDANLNCTELTGTSVKEPEPEQDPNPNPEPEQDQKPEIEKKTITVYFDNTQNWGEVWAYTWGSGVSEEGWPGVPLTADEDYAYETEWDVISQELIRMALIRTVLDVEMILHPREIWYTSIL